MQKYYEIPSGWADLCAEAIDKISSVAYAQDLHNDLKILEVKEKFGKLCIYLNTYNEELEKIIKEYADKSEHTCARCGKQATMLTTMWIMPYCEDCVETYDIPAVSIEEFNKKLQEKIKFRGGK